MRVHVCFYRRLTENKTDSEWCLVFVTITKLPCYTRFFPTSNHLNIRLTKSKII